MMQCLGRGLADIDSFPVEVKTAGEMRHPFDRVCLTSNDMLAIQLCVTMRDILPFLPVTIPSRDIR